MSTNTPTYADNVIFGIIAKLDQRQTRSTPQSPVPGKRSHAAVEDEDEAYEAFLNSLSTNNQVHEYDRDVRNPISEQRIPILQWWCDNGAIISSSKSHGSRHSCCSSNWGWRGERIQLFRTTRLWYIKLSKRKAGWIKDVERSGELHNRDGGYSGK